MKRFSFSLRDIRILLFAPVIFLFIENKTIKGVIILIISLISFSGCFKNYFKINSRPVTDSASLAALKNSDKYFIIHLSNGFYALKNIAANGSNIEGDLQKLPPERKQFIFAGDKSSKTYKSRNRHLLFSEIHLYAENEIVTDTNHISIPLKSVSKIDIFEKDTGKTIGSYVLGGLGVFLGIPLLMFLIVLVTCNCPHLYTFDGNQYNFKSGVFSGAIYSSLEKTDYLPLENLQSIQGQYLFKLANNQKEEQYINEVQLINVEHNTGKKVLLDRKGTPHTYSADVTAAQTENMSKEVAEALKYKDGNVYMFNENSDPKSPFGSVILNFNRTAGSNDGKLIIHAKNTLWSGYIFDEFSAMFGSKYQSWVSKQDNANKEVIEKWQQQQALPLMVYVETDNGWAFVDYFSFTGNTAGRDMIMQLKLPEHKNNIRVKIECTYMFWELDYAAMDFSIDDAVKINYLNLATAVKNNDEIKIDSVLKKDKNYTALKEDEFIKLGFTAPAEIKEKEKSLFLLSTGYYHSTKEFTGKTQTASLYQFKKKGAFNQYSIMKFKYAKEALAKGINLQRVTGSE